ncbi:hypothetical protein TorRG33x02_245060, partial [Trema orientale]
RLDQLLLGIQHSPSFGLMLGQPVLFYASNSFILLPLCSRWTSVTSYLVLLPPSA